MPSFEMDNLPVHNKGDRGGGGERGGEGRERGGEGEKEEGQ